MLDTTVAVPAAVLPDDQFLNDREIANWLGISRAKLKKDRQRGAGLPFHKFGKSIRYRVGDVRAWLKDEARNRLDEKTVKTSNSQS